MKKMKLLLASVLLPLVAFATDLSLIGSYPVLYKASFCMNEPVYYRQEYEGGQSICKIYSYEDLSLVKTININADVVGLDLDNAYDGYEGLTENLEITQTLFNDDDKYEFLVCLYAEEDGETVEKWQVLNEDGDLVLDLPGRRPEIHRLKNCFAISMDDMVENKINYYKIINGSSTGVASLQYLTSTKAYPNPVNSSNSFTIEVDETKLGTTNYVEVVDESGRMVYRSELKGAKAIVPARRMRGMNVYRIVSDGEVVDTGKMLVK